MNWAAGVKRLIEAFWGDHVRVGVVTGTAGDLVSVRWSDQPGAEPQAFRRLASYAAPQAGDAVVCIKISSARRADWVVIGDIER